MGFKNLRYSKGWFVVLASVIGLSYGGYTFVHRAVSEQVYVTNCGILDYKPTGIIKFCGDTLIGIDQILWLTWSAEVATGDGKYQINDCQPSCAEGTLRFADVAIILSKPKSVDGKKALTFISIKSKDGRNLPLSNSQSDGWSLELAG